MPRCGRAHSKFATSPISPYGVVVAVSPDAARTQDSRPSAPYLARRAGVLRELAEGVILWVAFQL